METNIPVTEVVAEAKPVAITIKEKITNILQANSIIADLRSDNSNLLAKLTEAENEIANLKNMSVEMTDKQASYDAAVATLKAEYEKTITSLKTDYEKQISDLTAKLAESETSTEAKAITTLAKIGVPVEDQSKLVASPELKPSANNGRGRFVFINHLQKP